MLLPSKRGSRKEKRMREAPKQATGQPLPRLKPPPDTARMTCVNCGSDETRALYQHVHENGVVAYEVPAYATKTEEVPCNWPCLCGDIHVRAVYVQCGACGYIGRVDSEKKRVCPPTKKEA